MPRIKMFNEQEALEKAMLLFWEKGYTATSLTDLTQSMGISKGSFYDTFHGKHDLFEKVFEIYRATMLDKLKGILDSETDVKQGMRKLMTFTVEEAFNDEQHKGCFAANVCSELGGRDDYMGSILRDHNSNVRTIIANYLSNDPRLANPEQLAGFFLTVLTGINQEVKVQRDKNKLLQTVEMSLHLLND